jgi:hypothetical protein
MGKGMLENSQLRWRSFALSVLGVAVIAAIGIKYFIDHRDDPPTPGQTDVDAQGVGARVDWTKGKVLTRPARPEEYEFREPAGILETPREVSGDGSPLYPGSWFGLEAGSSIQLITTGNFILILDGPGEFLFEDARREDGDGVTSKGKHVLFFRVKRGSLRAKKHDYDDGQHWLQVTVPKGKVLLEQGEIGVETNPEGNGRFWVVAGKVVYRPKDGPRQADLPRGIYPL